MRNVLANKNPRLRELYQLDDRIGADLLGADKQKYRKLMNLRYKVRAEIRAILKEEKTKREEFIARTREKMKEVGFVPSSEREEDLNGEE